MTGPLPVDAVGPGALLKKEGWDLIPLQWRVGCPEVLSHSWQEEWEERAEHLGEMEKEK